MAASTLPGTTLTREPARAHPQLPQPSPQASR